MNVIPIMTTRIRSKWNIKYSE